MSLKQVERKVNQLAGEKKIKGVLKKSQIPAITLLLIIGLDAQATVFINEVFINPQGSPDADREYIELLGTPGMKLDGYAIAVLNGTETKLYDPCDPCTVIPPVPAPEIDEFFSLDGLTLGDNGLLALLIRKSKHLLFSRALIRF